MSKLIKDVKHLLLNKFGLCNHSIGGIIPFYAKSIATVFFYGVVNNGSC